MKIQKDRVYIQQWLDFKPYMKQTKTDFYYLKLCNSVRESFASFELSYILSPDDTNDLACFLTSYFEDVISESNIWNSFVKAHKRLYDKPLPFYDISKYYENEINIQDVCFLIWYFLNTIQEQNFFGFTSGLVSSLASNVMDVFDVEWDYAPENEQLNKFYSLSTDVDDYYDARELMDNILFNSYLFHFDTHIKLISSESEIVNDFKNNVEKNKNEKMLLARLQEDRDASVHNFHTRLLALKGNEWGAEFVGKEHPLYNSFLTISKRISGFFFYKGQDGHNIFIEHIASGKKFNITKKSFEDSTIFQKIDSILFIGIVRWMDEWWFSGIHFDFGYDADLVLDEKKSRKSRRAVSFLDHEKNQSSEFIEKQYNAFLEFNNNQAVAFLEGGEINNFIQGSIQYFNDSLNLSKKEREKSAKRARKEGFYDDPEGSSTDFEKDAENGIVFFNPNSGIEVALELNSAFPDLNNPFFNEIECKDHLMGLLVSESVSAALAKYCIENYEANLPFFKTTEGVVIFENIDFLLRFWKRESYFSEPSISYTGLN